MDRNRLLKVFGENVRGRRHEIGLSQEALAARSGLHRTYVGSVERGERNIALVNIYLLAEALDCDPSGTSAALEQRFDTVLGHRHTSERTAT